MDIKGYRKMKGGAVLRLLAVLVTLAPGAAASTDMDQIVRTLARQDAIVAEIGERLSIAAVSLCPPGGWAAGLVVQSRAQYAPEYRAIAGRVLGLGAYPTITYVLPDGAARRAGLRSGDQVTAIETLPTTADAAQQGRARMDDTARALDALDAGMRDGSVDLRVLRGGATVDVAVQAVPACRVRFEVRPGNAANASAGRDVVQVSSDLIDPARADPNLAPLIAHELSHVILRHADVLRRHRGGLLPGFGKGGAALRASEIAADRLSVYLLAMAGFRPSDAIAFWTRFGSATDQGILSDRTHPGWKARVAAIREEVARIDAQRADGQAIRPPADLLATAYR